MTKFEYWPLVIASATAIIGVVIFCWFVRWGTLTHCFKVVKVSDLPSTLAPLAFAAAIIERAVEILISPWRDEGASKLQKALAVVKAKPVADATELKAASDAVDAYQGDTQRYAFVVSITLSSLASIAGFPSLGLFVDTDKCAWLSQAHQGSFFHCVDVLLSAALLAGGADGIHSIVNAVTSFFQATAQKATP